MYIKYTKEFSTCKENAIKNLSKSNWYIFDKGNYEVLIQLYKNGHTVNISDLYKTDTYILDCDHLTDEQVNNLDNTLYLIRIM